MYAVYEKLTTDGSYWILAAFAFRHHADAYVKGQEQQYAGLPANERPTYKVVQAPWGLGPKSEDDLRDQDLVTWIQKGRNIDADPSIDEAAHANG